jgi:tetratricopeptide (TPR) repeat protein
MSVSPRDWLLAGAAGLILAAGVVVWAFSALGLGGTREPHLTLAQLGDEVGRQVRAGRFDRAQAVVASYLRRDPRSAAALVMMAELDLDRPEPNPVRAIEWLRRVETQDPRLASQAKLDEGRADRRLGRYAAAESACLDALRLNPTIGEAGWALLDLYYLQGRSAEARALALRLHEVETDPHDRVQLLLELVRQDAQTTDPSSIAQRFEPVVAQDPADLHSTLALGLALVRDHHADQGLSVLRKAVQAFTSDPDAWDALLTGLGRAGRHEELAETLDRLPKALADSPRFAQYRGQVAWDRGDMKEAVGALQRAWEFDPGNHEVLYRLARSLRAAGQAPLAERFDERARRFEAGRQEVRALYEEANAMPALGNTPHIDMYRRLADLRERMGRLGEARAWYRLILEALPDDAQSLDAIKRLEDFSGRTDR